MKVFVVWLMFSMNNTTGKIDLHGQHWDEGSCNTKITETVKIGGTADRIFLCAPLVVGPGGQVLNKKALKP